MHVLARNLTLNIHHFLAQLFALFLAELRLVGRILRIRKRKRKGKNRQHYHPKAFRKSSFECFCFFSLKPLNSLRGSKFLAKHFANTRTLTRKELFLMLNIEQFEKIACQLRRDIIRMTALAGSGHPGGSLSAVDFLTVLYFHVLNHKPSEPSWEERDRVIYSKAHITPAIYSVLARAGYFDPKELETFRKLHSRLQGHPAKNKNLPGIEISGGSLGQGLSVAVGLALGLRDKKKLGLTKSNRIPFVYSINGDGEMEEGNIWEGIMSAGHYKIENLIAIVDKNSLQIDGWVKDVMNIDPLPDKFAAFNWHVIECDGHNYNEILAAFEKARELKDKPKVIIAHTTKGKGISFMENGVEWHGKAPKKEQALQALKELGADPTLEIESEPIFAPVG